jgi:hypothetical protein
MMEATMTETTTVSDMIAAAKSININETISTATEINEATSATTTVAAINTGAAKSINTNETISTANEINEATSATAIVAAINTGTVPHDTLDNLLLQTVHEHPFSVSGGALIIGITVLKIIKKLRGK